jgi:hypothetical protein
LGASALQWGEGYITPQELSKEQIKKLIQDHVDATIRAEKLGFGNFNQFLTFKMLLKFTEHTVTSFLHSIHLCPTNELMNMEVTLKVEQE